VAKRRVQVETANRLASLLRNFKIVLDESATQNEVDFVAVDGSFGLELEPELIEKEEEEEVSFFTHLQLLELIVLQSINRTLGRIHEPAAAKFTKKQLDHFMALNKQAELTKQVEAGEAAAAAEPTEPEKEPGYEEPADSPPGYVNDYGGITGTICYQWVARLLLAMQGLSKIRPVGPSSFFFFSLFFHFSLLLLLCPLHLHSSTSSSTRWSSTFTSTRRPPPPLPSLLLLHLHPLTQCQVKFSTTSTSSLKG
jgi:hypothetical protein